MTNHANDPVITAQSARNLIAACYDGVTPDAQVTMLGGKSNVSLRVCAGQRDIVFKFYPKAHHRCEDITEEIRFVTFASANRLPVARYYPGRNGKILQVTADHFIVGSHYLDGRPFSNLPLTRSRMSSVCALFEDFLRVSRAYDRIPPQADSLHTRLRAMYRRLNDTAPDPRFRSLTAFFTRKLDTAAAALSGRHDRQFLHLDFSPHNLLMASEDDSAYLFDFENWIWDSAIVDLASAVLEFAVESGGCRFDCAGMLIDAYRRAIPGAYCPEDLIHALKCLCALYYAYITIESGDYEFALLYYKKCKIISSRQFLCRLREISAENSPRKGQQCEQASI